MIQNTKYKKGFTLIEFLVVVAIMMLLGAIVLVSLEKSKARSRDTKRVTDIQSISQTLNIYQNNEQAYPIYTGYITSDDPMSLALETSRLISNVPVDPFNREVEGLIYKYYYQSADAKTYLLRFCQETDSIQRLKKGCDNEVRP